MNKKKENNNIEGREKRILNVEKEKESQKKEIVDPNKTKKPKSNRMISSKDGNDLKDDDNEISTRKVRIKVIGVGGGGSNIVFELSKKLKDFSAQKIEFIAANTDNQALHSISKSLKTFSFGSKITNGLGCGSDVSVGDRAAREDLERIKGLFSDNRDLYIIVSSFGGGTGTGAAPVFAKIASDLKLPVLSIFTLPFVFEGKKKTDHSLAAIEKLKEDINAYMVLPNEKIFSLSKEEVSFSEALSLLNDYLAGSLEGLFRTIYNPGLINIDWADIKTVLEGNKKIAYLDVIKIKNSQNLEEFAKNILHNPILDYNFENADNIIFNIESSKDLSLQLLSQISEKISIHVPNARIIFGLTQNPKLKNEIKITLFATTSDDGSANQKDWRLKNTKNRLRPIIKDGVLNLENQEEENIEDDALLTEEGTVNTIIEKEIGVNLKKDEEKEVATVKEFKKRKKIRPRVKKIEDKEKEETPLEVNEKKDNNKEQTTSPIKESEDNPVRRNALQAKEFERLERENEDSKENIFDIPTFLRKEKDKK